MKILKTLYYLCLIILGLSCIFWPGAIIYISIQAETHYITLWQRILWIFIPSIPGLFSGLVLKILNEGDVKDFGNFKLILRRICAEWEPGIFTQKQIQRELRFGPA